MRNNNCKWGDDCSECPMMDSAIALDCYQPIRVECCEICGKETMEDGYCPCDEIPKQGE